MKKNFLSLLTIVCILVVFMPMLSVRADSVKYKVFEQKMTFEDAEAYCRSLGGHLVSITSQEEQKAVEAVLDEYNRNGGKDADFMIGICKRNNDYGVWTTGEKVIYTNWSELQPDDRGGQNYGVICNGDRSAFKIKKYEWDDNGAEGSKFGFICEWEAALSEIENNFLSTLEFNGNTYAVINKKLNWKDAKEYCNQLGGHLVTITSKEEDDAMYLLTQKSGNTGMLLGASDLSGTWEWVTGEEWNYTNWHPGEPSSNSEHYLSYHKNCDSRWNDWNEVPWYFICEWEHVRIPSGGDTPTTETPVSNARIALTSLNINGALVGENYLVSIDVYNSDYDTIYISISNTDIAEPDKYEVELKDTTNLKGEPYKTGDVNIYGKSVGKVVLTATLPDGTSKKKMIDVKHEEIVSTPSPAPTPTNRGFDATRDGWAFVNAARSFGYSECTDSSHEHEDDKTYHEPLPLNVWTQVFGGAVTQFSENLLEEHWGGNCYGMSAYAAAIYCGFEDWNEDEEVNEAGEIRRINGRRYIKAPDSTTINMIERAQISQYSIEASQNESAVSGEQNNIFSQVVNNIRNNKKTYVVSVFYPGGGHAMVTDSARGVEDSGNGWYKIYLYDPNYPHYDDSENMLYGDSYTYWNMRWVNVNVNTGDWKMDVGVGGKEAKSGFLRKDKIYFEDPNWHRGHDDFTGYTIDSDNTVFINGANIALEDFNGETLLEIEDGEIIYSSDDIDIYHSMARAEDADTTGFSGKIKLNNETLGKASIENAAFTLINDKKVTQVHTYDEAECVVSGNEVSVTADDDAEVKIVSENMYSRDAYDAVTITGILEDDKTITVNNKGKDDYEITTDSDNTYHITQSSNTDDVTYENIKLDNYNTSSGENKKGFSDISSLTDKQEEAINYAFDNGVMEGYDDGSIRPYNTITRAEFATMMCRYFGFKTNKKSDFKDVSSHWATSYIRACTDAGAINGIGDNKFNPNGTITFEQAVKIFTVLKGYTDNVNIENMGGYPDAYIKIGSELNLFDDMTVTSKGNALPRIDVAMLIYNSHDISEYVPINDNTGNVGSQKDISIPSFIIDEYDYVDEEYLYHNGEWIYVELDGKCGMVNKSGKVVIDIKYDSLFECNDYHYYVAKYNGKYGVIDDKEHIVLSWLKKNITLFPIEGGDYIEKSYIKEETEGIITYIGQEVIPMGKYWGLKYYSDNFIIAIKDFELENEATGVIDISGKTVIPFEYFKLNKIKGKNMLIASRIKNDNWDMLMGVIDTSNNIIMPFAEYDDMCYSSDSCVYVEKNGKWGVVDIKGNVVTAPELDYVRIYICPDSIYNIAKSNKKYFIIDSKGEKVSEKAFDDLEDAENHMDTL